MRYPLWNRGCRGSARISRHVLAFVLAGMLGAGTPAMAGESGADPLHAPQTEEAAKGTDAKQCNWECEQWTKLCNIDPRGVYSCRRNCARFGQVCEE